MKLIRKLIFWTFLIVFLLIGSLFLYETRIMKFDPGSVIGSGDCKEKGYNPKDRSEHVSCMTIFKDSNGSKQSILDTNIDTKKQILILHGEYTSSRSRREVIKEMNNKGRNVIIPDLPHSGSSAFLDSDQGEQSESSRLIEYLDQKKIGRFSILSEGTGNQISVDLWNNYPRRVSHMIFLPETRENTKEDSPLSKGTQLVKNNIKKLKNELLTNKMTSRIATYNLLYQKTGKSTQIDTNTINGYISPFLTSSLQKKAIIPTPISQEFLDGEYVDLLRDNKTTKHSEDDFAAAVQKYGVKEDHIHESNTSGYFIQEHSPTEITDLIIQLFTKDQGN